MPDFAIRYDDFSGGDFGETDPARAEKNQYRGSNVFVYESGLLGVRPGAKVITTTGLPNHPVAPGPMGFGVLGSDLLIVLSHLYRVPMAGGAATAYTNYPAAATTEVVFAQAKNVLYSLKSGIVYKHVGTGTVAATMPPGITFSHLVQWEQWLVGVDAALPWRIYFTFLDSSGPNFDSWPANNYLDIGANGSIVAMLPIFNTLYLGKKGGWWAVSGVLGIQASVRQIALGNGPKDRRLAATTTDNRVIYWPNEDVPTFFNGDRTRPASRYKMRQAQTVPPSVGVAVTPTGQKLILSGDAVAANAQTDIYVYDQGRWSYHEFGVAIGGIVPNDVREADSMPSGVVFTVRNPTAVGLAPIISSFQHDLDRPANATDTYASPTDPGDTDLVRGSFTLPAWYDGQGRQVTVKAVIVQFRKWTSGVANSLNRITCTVTSAGQYESADNPSATVTSEWTEPSDLADDEGLDDSWRLTMGLQGEGNGFIVAFPVLAGVAIREVIVLADVKQSKV